VNAYNFVIGAKIGQPLPVVDPALGGAKDAFDTNHDAFEEGGDQFEKQFTVGFNILVDDPLFPGDPGCGYTCYGRADRSRNIACVAGYKH
jgi:hypothetical protein